MAKPCSSSMGPFISLADAGRAWAAAQGLQPHGCYLTLNGTRVPGYAALAVLLLGRGVLQEGPEGYTLAPEAPPAPDDSEQDTEELDESDLLPDVPEAPPPLPAPPAAPAVQAKVRLIGDLTQVQVGGSPAVRGLWCGLLMRSLGDVLQAHRAAPARRVAVHARPPRGVVTFASVGDAVEALGVPARRGLTALLLRDGAIGMEGGRFVLRTGAEEPRDGVPLPVEDDPTWPKPAPPLPRGRLSVPRRPPPH